MKCEWVRQNILFYVYNELEDDARYEVEEHLGRCPECATELKATRKFHATLSQLAVSEPTPNLVASSKPVNLASISKFTFLPSTLASPEARCERSLPWKSTLTFPPCRR